MASFKKHIKQQNWDILVFCDNFNSAYSSFSSILILTYKLCFPLEKIKINYKNRNPWINKTLRKEIRDKLFVIQTEKYSKQRILRNINI